MMCARRQTLLATTLTAALCLAATGVAALGPDTVVDTSPEWLDYFGDRRMEDGEEDRGFGVAEADDGTIYVTGAGDHTFISRYTAEGDLMWTDRLEADDVPADEQTVSVSAFELVVASPDEIYLAGETAGSLPGQEKLGRWREGFVARYDGLGQLVWARQMGDPGGPTRYEGVTLTSTGNIVAAGESDDQAIIVTYSPDGELLRHLTLDTGFRPAAFLDAAVAPDGTTHAVGWIYTVEGLDVDSSPIWATFGPDDDPRALHDLIDHGYEHRALGVEVDADGDVWVLGTAPEGADGIVFPARLGRFSPTGTPRWVHSYLNPREDAELLHTPTRLTLTADGTSAVTGLSDTVDDDNAFVDVIGPDGHRRWFAGFGDHRLAEAWDVALIDPDAAVATGVTATSPFTGEDEHPSGWVALITREPSGPAPPAAGTRLADAPDPVAAAVALSQSLYPDPAVDAPQRVVIGRSDSPADSLAGGGLARDGLMLLHPPPGTGPSAAVLGELDRLGFGPDACADGPRVFLMGGEAALGPDLHDAIGPCATRVSGSERNATAAQAAQVLAETFGTPDVVFVARNDNAADSAATSVITSRNGLPVLITPTDQLASPARTFLADHPTVDQVYVIGGTGAVSVAVEEELRTLVPNVERIAGATRDDTAVALMDRFVLDGTNRIGLVEGHRPDFWAYALPAGAGGVDALVFVNGTTQMLSEDTQRYLSQQLPDSDVIAHGPTDRVSDSVLSQAQALVGTSRAGP